MSDLKLFDNFDQLARSGYLFRIGDNRGETADRYTVLFSDGDALGMNESGIGFSQFVGSVDPNVFEQQIELGNWDDVGPDDLSDGTKNHIVRRINETFQDFLNDLAEGKCPRSREAIEKENDGSYDCAGDGIWWDGENFFVAVEENDDRGPFATPAEAVRASLPDEYSLAGPEYHSAHFPTRPAPEMSEDIAGPA